MSGWVGECVRRWKERRKEDAAVVGDEKRKEGDGGCSREMRRMNGER